MDKNKILAAQKKNIKFFFVFQPHQIQVLPIRFDLIQFSFAIQSYAVLNHRFTMITTIWSSKGLNWSHFFLAMTKNWIPINRKSLAAKNATSFVVRQFVVLFGVFFAVVVFFSSSSLCEIIIFGNFVLYKNVWLVQNM